MEAKKGISAGRNESMKPGEKVARFLRACLQAGEVFGLVFCKTRGCHLKG